MSDPNAVFQQAISLCERGDFDAAVALYRQLLTQIPGHPQILSALGNAELGQGNIAEGIAVLRRSLAIFAPQPDAWCNLARGLRQQRHYADALDAADQALALAPDLFEAWMCRGNIVWDMDRMDEALAAYARARALRPTDARVHFNCANTLHRLGRLQEAAGAFAHTVALAPDYAEAHLNAAKVLDALAQPVDALVAIDRALALRPDDPEVLLTRGIVLASLTRFDEALAAFGGAIARDPAKAEAYRWRGLVFEKMRQPAEAVADHERALALKPDYVEAEFDRAAALTELARYDDALAGYDRVLAVAPDFAMAGWNRALIALACGDFASGWKGYEARWRNKTAAAILETSHPRWTGEDPKGKTILIWPEQGFGDFVQFCRYVPLLAAMGARVIVEAPPRLKPLLAGLNGAAAVIEHGAPRPPYDLQCPVMSLPLTFGTTLATIPAAVPYLAADPAKTAAFDAALGPRPRIGLVWSGNATQEHDFKRSMPLAVLEPVLQLPMVFHALQVEFRPSDTAAMARWSVHRHADEQADFADAAALIAAMDLVITVDTAVAHVAGALGKPVWLLLPYAAEWRWLRDRADSPWYPTMRLFRQAQRGDWSGVIEAVAAALQDRFGLCGN